MEQRVKKEKGIFSQLLSLSIFGTLLMIAWTIYNGGNVEDIFKKENKKEIVEIDGQKMTAEQRDAKILELERKLYKEN